MADGSVLDGQSSIMRTRGIRRIWVTPGDCEATIDAIAAIGSAELIVVGPGSLYTSLLPSLVVPGVAEALAAAPAKRVFVCNVATQPGETEGYTLSEHLAALNAHGVGGLFDVVVANGNRAAKRPTDYRAEPVRIDVPDTVAPRLVIDDVVDDENAHRHDPRKLTTVLMRLHDETTTAVPTPTIVRSA